MNDKLYYYSLSKDLYPGKGVDEFVNEPTEYEQLSKIKDWRKILSNFYVYPISYNGYTYNTVEHAFQASKIRLVDENKAFLFTMESNSDLGLGDGNQARKNRKMVILSNDKLQHWNSIKDQIMFDINLIKFTNSDLCKNVLLNTNKAEIHHIFMRSKKRERSYYLEKIRDILNK